MRRTEFQTATAQHCESIRAGLRQSSFTDPATVAVGRGVDEQQQPLGAAGCDGAGGRLPAILGADVHGRRPTDLAAREDRTEFFGVIVTEEHGVVGEIETPHRCAQAPGDCGEGALRRWDRSDRRSRTDPKCAARERIGIAVKEHGIGLEHLAGRQLHAGHAPALRQDLRDMRVVSIARTMPQPKSFEGERDPAHPPFDEPDALLFDMGDQHQCGGRGERR